MNGDMSGLKNCPMTTPELCSVEEQRPDPWVHRSAGMRCRTCLWFVEKQSHSTIPRRAVGRCRRHAPTMNGYPVVFNDDWCGDHKLDENKT